MDRETLVKIRDSFTDFYYLMLIITSVCNFVLVQINSAKIEKLEEHYVHCQDQPR